MANSPESTVATGQVDHEWHEDYTNAYNGSYFSIDRGQASGSASGSSSATSWTSNWSDGSSSGSNVFGSDFDQWYAAVGDGLWNFDITDAVDPLHYDSEGNLVGFGPAVNTPNPGAASLFALATVVHK